ncbi:hypothetical protein FC70_GL001123 [Paucilactobacillus oligofermentans DSM 15707 = LMG 22743]|uniref:WxL domain-containing protein n=1 Tax=Paucilactobacillus oligofermentans DSM 15707 = LMG 22743 TaxID=1423778 RepID=A0A0R1RMW4_9LACO|nr:WxL domain-containing protein [Paucilactobacillus oligofermentans]KRL55522.1 hypothetical protein FC70_GL001123 [Paucilactobacillus oligofermentans DSM 15707 = LMG 22743]CUS25490.1 Cell surface protein, CscC family [Paucilactobacillus oligofermentans DSM 15707 = LMG 22743]
MQIKRIIYLSLLMLVTFSGAMIITSSVSAVDTNETSSISSQSSSFDSSETSSSQSAASSSAASSSAASSSAASSSSDKSANAKSVVAPQTDPAAPTADDGVQEADWTASYFIIPIITGFQVQPQSEQYVVADSSGNATVDLGFKAAFFFFPVLGSYLDYTPTQWKWNDSTGKWDKTVIKTQTASFLLTGNPKISYKPLLSVGTYYYQIDGAFRGALGNKDSKISKLVKVVVVPAAVQAKSISITVPNVIFANAAYEGNAVTDPVDATGKISWTGSSPSGDWNEITWDQQTGRNSNFTVDNDKQPTTINTSTTDPGTPILIAANIDNATGASGTANDTKTTYVGGLVAKKMAADEGGTWSLDAAGLKDLEASVNPASGTNVTWNYQWQYSTDGTGKDSSFKNIPAAADGVTNISGNVSSATELSNTSNVLTFSKNSSWVNGAATATTSGTDYVVREKLTATVTDESKKVTNIEIDSNAAGLTVTGATGKLSLEEVPSFNFGDVSASNIYNGTIVASQTKPEAKSTLTVSDTRVDSNDWTLTAKMTKFENGNSTGLDTNTMLQMNNLMDDVSAILTDNDVSTEVLSSKQGDAGSWETTGQLLLNANPNVELNNGDNFSSTITWNLTAGTPNATAAK